MKLEWVELLSGTKAMLRDNHRWHCPNLASVSTTVGAGDVTVGYSVRLWTEKGKPGLWVPHEHMFTTMEEAKAYALAAVMLGGLNET